MRLYAKNAKNIVNKKKVFFIHQKQSKMKLTSSFEMVKHFRRDKDDASNEL